MTSKILVLTLRQKHPVNKMTSVKFKTTGELDISPSATSSNKDFDFLVGEWNIHNKKLKSRLSNSNEWIEFDATHEMRKVLTDIGNVENIHTTIEGEAYEGMAIRLFTRQPNYGVYIGRITIWEQWKSRWLVLLIKI